MFNNNNFNGYPPGYGQPGFNQQQGFPNGNYYQQARQQQMPPQQQFMNQQPQVRQVNQPYGGGQQIPPQQQQFMNQQMPPQQQFMNQPMRQPYMGQQMPPQQPYMEQQMNPGFGNQQFMNNTPWGQRQAPKMNGIGGMNGFNGASGYQQQPQNSTNCNINIPEVSLNQPTCQSQMQEQHSVEEYSDYKPARGNELPPLYDEETETIVKLYDHITKTYVWKVNKI